MAAGFSGGLEFQPALGRFGGLHLDIHHPVPGTAAPVILFAHGGGFKKGSREFPDRSPVPQVLNDAGFAVVTVDYRINVLPADFAPETVNAVEAVQARTRKAGLTLFHRLFGLGLYAAMQDISVAMRYLRVNAHALSLRADRIALMGESAGAIAALALAHCPQEWAEGMEAPDRVLGICGALVHPWRMQAGGVPCLIYHGARDKIISVADARLIEGKSRRRGANVDVQILPKQLHNGLVGHVLTGTEPDGTKPFERISAFLAPLAI